MADVVCRTCSQIQDEADRELGHWGGGADAEETAGGGQFLLCSKHLGWPVCSSVLGLFLVLAESQVASIPSGNQGTQSPYKHSTLLCVMLSVALSYLPYFQLRKLRLKEHKVSSQAGVRDFKPGLNGCHTRALPCFIACLLLFIANTGTGTNIFEHFWPGMESTSE